MATLRLTATNSQLLAFFIDVISKGKKFLQTVCFDPQSLTF